MTHLRWWLVMLAVALSPMLRAEAADQRNKELKRIELPIDGINRESLVYVPDNAKTAPMPIVFVFHGHGGTMRNAERSFEIEKYWPEAIVAYPQGLKTPGQITDPEGNRVGWQALAGNQNDRDLKFFDALLAKLKSDYQVDAKRIYATGHSNGGGFTYLLWAQRGEVLTAVAPSSAAARFAITLKPKPAFIIGGENDPLVKFAWQKATIEAVKQVNGCEPDGKSGDKLCTIYPSKIGAPLVTLIHPGGHEFSRTAPELIVKFFQSLPLAKTD
jgi:polyhydroxybutyrate depolymerase